MAELAVSPCNWVPMIERSVYKHLLGEPSGHDPCHAFRVRDLAVRIARSIRADSEIVEAAALLHDIGHAGGRPEHAHRGATLAATLLSESCFPAHKVPAVTLCIEGHHWLPNRAGDPKSPTPEYQAFADADRLDALGAIGIARTFAFGGAHGRPIWNPAPEAPEGPYGISSLHHFDEKLMKLPEDMYTEMGRSIAERRVGVLQDFLRSFHLEWEGGDVEMNSSFARRMSIIEHPPEAIGKGPRSRP
jgi:uncharacterized protein